MVVPELVEWDYGDYEGLTTAEIRKERPDWSLWTDGCPNGEWAADVGRRADEVLAFIADRSSPDDAVGIFGHGHMLRVLAARWVGLAPEQGYLFRLDTTSLSVLDREPSTGRPSPILSGGRLWLPLNYSETALLCDCSSTTGCAKARSEPPSSSTSTTAAAD